MSVPLGSRYANAKIEQIRMPDGSTRPSLQRIIPQRRRISFSPTSVGGAFSRADAMAAAVYQDDTRWWVIADANPERFWWDDLPGGLILRVPDGPRVL